MTWITGNGSDLGTEGAETVIRVELVPKGDAAVEELKRRSVSFGGPIIDDDPVKLACFTDPDGN